MACGGCRPYCYGQQQHRPISQTRRCEACYPGYLGTTAHRSCQVNSSSDALVVPPSQMDVRPHTCAPHVGSTTHQELGSAEVGQGWCAGLWLVAGRDTWRDKRTQQDGVRAHPHNTPVKGEREERGQGRGHGTTGKKGIFPSVVALSARGLYVFYSV